MSLPPPAYATTVTYTQPGATVPIYNSAPAILVESGIGSPSFSDYIIWDNLVERDQQAVIDLVDLYGGTLPPASPIAASDYVDFGGAAGGDLTGLDFDRYYYATVYVDGVRYSDKWLGIDLATYTAIETAVGAMLSGVATASLGSGVLTIESAGSPISNNTIKIQKGDDWNVFRRAADFTAWGISLPAATSTKEIFENNKLPISMARLP